MKNFTALVFGILLLSEAALGQTLDNSLQQTKQTREFIQNHLEEKDKGGKADTDAAFAFMDILIRHKEPSADSIRAMYARANTGEIGGMFQKDLFKKLAAILAVDWYIHEQKEQTLEREHRNQLASLEDKSKTAMIMIASLQGQIDQLKAEHKKAQ